MLKHFDERRSAFTPYGFTCELWEPYKASRPDRHDEIEINFLDRGTLTYFLGGERFTVEPRVFTMFWGAIPHQILSFSGVTYYHVVTIPFELFLQWSPPEELLTRLIMGQMVADANQSRNVDDSSIFKQWHQDLAHPTPQLNHVVQLEMAARILRVQLATVVPESRGSTRPETSASLGKAETMACFVARNYRARLQIKEIAETVDLHPDYASTLFRQTFGVTLTSLITKHRVAEAQRRLLTTDESILNIAFECGFDSLSRFNRAFKEVAGMPPREYRKQKQWIGPVNSSSMGKRSPAQKSGTRNSGQQFRNP